MQRIFDWFVASVFIGAYLVGIGFVLLAMSKEVCAAEFSLDLGGNGQLRIFNKQCATDESKMGGYLLPKTGKRVWACWIFKNDKVHVWFDDGSYLSFPWTDMHPVIDGSEYSPPPPKKPVRKRFLET